MKILGTHNYYVYLLTNKSKTVHYTGVTNNLRDRLYFQTHPEPFSKAFTKKYNCFNLVHYERYAQVEDAINREKQIKGWSREKKNKLVEEKNPNWKFLNDSI